MKHTKFLLMVVLVLSLPLTAVFGSNTGTDNAPVSQEEEFVFGMILVGPHDDRGYSQAHYEGGLYVEEHIPGTRMVWVDKINPADNPDRTIDVVVDELVSQGAQLIIANSDEYKNDINFVAPLYPDVTFIHISGDAVLTGEAPENVGNIFGRMEYGKMIAGCAAALMTDTGKISYLGPLINNETRRLAASVFLGARHCYETYRGLDPAALQFDVVWIGFWFEIPGFTLNPTEVTNDFYNNGSDVVISGIDTTQAIVVAGQRGREGERVFAIPYDFVGACEEAPEQCLGVPYFNWGPTYVNLVNSVMADTYVPAWEWNAPDWTDINNHDTSNVGYLFGEGLSADAVTNLNDFIAKLTAGAAGEEGGVVLWQGPLNLQDGTAYLAEGEVATDEQIWYLPQLLEGMVGDSVPAESE